MNIISWTDRLALAAEMVQSVPPVVEMAPGMADQFQAACVSNILHFRDLAKHFPEENTGIHDADHLQRIHMMAALMDIHSVCVHANQSPRPVWVLLGSHCAVCPPCAHALDPPLAEEADRCDCCGSRGNTKFASVVMTFGPLLVIGDVCSDCAQVLVHA